MKMYEEKREIKKMATVQGPMFSTFATGSLNKGITFRPLWNGRGFSVAKHKWGKEKRQPIQDYNAQVFKEKRKASLKLQQKENLLYPKAEDFKITEKK